MFKLSENTYFIVQEVEVGFIYPLFEKMLVQMISLGNRADNVSQIYWLYFRIAG